MLETTSGWMVLVYIALIVWTVIWKGVALWKAAAKKRSVGWFVALLIVNTLGILEILYIFVFSKYRNEKQGKTTKKKKRR